MFGFFYLLWDILLRIIGKTGQNISTELNNYHSKKNSINKYKTEEDHSLVYVDNKGKLRDVISDALVYYRHNEYGEVIVSEIYPGQKIGYKDIRNVSQIHIENRLKANIDYAKRYKKTVALHLYSCEVECLNDVIDFDYVRMIEEKYKKRSGYYLTDKDKVLSFGYMGARRIKSPSINYPKGNRYIDIDSNAEYVIRIFEKNNGGGNTYSKNKEDTRIPYRYLTAFYMDIKTGHLIRRTDNQIQNDSLYPEWNAISIEETDSFIDKFNSMQDSNKDLLVDANQMNDYFWFNDKYIENNSLNSRGYNIGNWKVYSGCEENISEKELAIGFPKSGNGHSVYGSDIYIYKGKNEIKKEVEDKLVYLN